MTTEEKPVFPLPGMTVVPAYYHHPAWDMLFGGAWIGLVQFLLGQEEYRTAFERDTGHKFGSIIARSPIERMIDTATGHAAQNSTMATWCDWVTTNHWGPEGTEEDEP